MGFERWGGLPRNEFDVNLELFVRCPGVIKLRELRASAINCLVTGGSVDG